MSKIIVDEIQTNTTNGNVRIIPNGTGVLEVNGSCTATTFSGSGANLTNLPAPSTFNAANLTGTLPAISGANLTSIPAANLTGTLPAIDGSALTGVGGGGFQFVSKSEITSGNTAAYIDFTSLENDTMYRLVGKQIVFATAGNERFQFKDTSGNLISSSINYTYHYGSTSSSTAGWTSQHYFLGAASQQSTNSAFILEFFTKPGNVWFYLNSQTTTGSRAFSQVWGSFVSTDTTTQVGGIRISENSSGYNLAAGTQILLYKYKES